MKNMKKRNLSKVLVALKGIDRSTRGSDEEYVRVTEEERAALRPYRERAERFGDDRGKGVAH